MYIFQVKECSFSPLFYYDYKIRNTYWNFIQCFMAFIVKSFFSSFFWSSMCYITLIDFYLSFSMFLNKSHFLLFYQYSIRLNLAICCLVCKHLYFVVCFFCDFLIRFRIQGNSLVIKSSKTFIYFQCSGNIGNT